MITIPGYTMIAPVTEDGDLMLYRATRRRDDLPVLLKVLAVPDPSPLILSRLEHEYELARDLDPDRIARTLALERYGSKVALVLAQGGTRTLASLLGSPMDIRSFLRIAIGINAALGELHSHELVHKDIKPEHVLLDEDSHAWLTGLGIASHLPRERQPPEPPEAIAGTLAYIAPEQTGRMNRSIDYRSDLYALGIIFYQMLTGVLPFMAEDAMEWVHCHITRQPVPPIHRVPSLPEPLSEMVMKLLAKNAEERYQSTTGLDADLRHCLADWEFNGGIAPFPLGTHDTPDRLLVPEKLYGRKSEIESLIAAFNRVMASGTTELVLVSGYSGIGKTSVVHELQKALVPPRGLFSAGKFDQYKRNIPYSTLVQTLQTLVRHILTKSEAEVEEWRNALQKAVGPNGQLIVSLIPEVELIIGEQPPVPDLPPQEARNRFQMVLLRFIGIFAGPEHPLVLFLDDLQWLDAATLDLLTRLTTESEVRSLLLIGAYRDNEVAPTHPLMRTIETIRKGGTGVQDIVLAPLTVNDVCNLIADALHCTEARALPLARLLHEKTGGNPFFVIQFLTALAEKKLLAFDRDAGRWIWDLTRIQARNYTDNVVDLMAEKLQMLPAATQEALKQLACLGNIVEIDTLAAIYGKTEEATRAALWQAVLAGLVFQQNNTCKFMHDRIQQAAYSLIPEGHHAEVHLHIGRLLFSHTLEDRLAENIFEIVGHMNRGAMLITKPLESRRLAELNLLAARRAMKSTAFASALAYLVTADAMLGDERWQEQYAFSFELELRRAQCEYILSDLTTAERRLTALADRATDLKDLSAVTQLQAPLYTTLQQVDRAVEVCLKCLSRAGIHWPAHPHEALVDREMENFHRLLGARSIGELIHLSPMKDPDALAVIEVLSALFTPAFFSDLKLLAMVAIHMSSFSIEHGNGDASAWGYLVCGEILGSGMGKYLEGYQFGKLGCDLVDKRDARAFRAQVYIAFGGQVSLWRKHLRLGRRWLEQVFDAAQEVGNIEYASYYWIQLLTNSLALGIPLEQAQQEAEKGIDYTGKAHFPLVQVSLTGQHRFILTMRGKTLDFGYYNSADFDETTFEAQLTEDASMAITTCFYRIRKLQARFFAHDYAGAVALSKAVERVLWTSQTYAIFAEHHYYSALSKAALYDHAPPETRKQLQASIIEHCAQLELLAHNCPENFTHSVALVKAEIARIEKRDQEAMQLYEQAIASALENEFIHNEAVAYETAAAFYRNRGFEKFSRAYVTEAHNCYTRWGADGKVQQLERLHLWLAQSQPSQAATLAEQLDAVSVAKAQRAISGEIHLDRLAKTLLRIVMESAGAQNGYLFVKGASQLRAEMQADDDGSQHIVFDASPQAANIPEAIINYVSRSRKTVILSNARAEAGEFSTDDYLRRVKPISVLGMPIQRQEKLLAVLYLENNLVSGAFTPEHRTVLEVLAVQAAISLETACVYEKLHESEERLRLTLEAMQIGTFDWDVQHDRFYLSPTYYTMLGYEPKEGPGNREEWLDRVHPDDRVHVEAKIQGALTRDSSSDQSREYAYEARLRHADGTYRWHQVKGFGIKRDQEGRVTRTLGIRMDITERRQAEEEIAWNLAISQALSSLYIPIVTADTSIEQIADAVLEKSRQLTSSAHGYVAEIDPATGDLIAHTNTKMLQTECKIAEDELRKIRFTRRADGLYNALWGHALNTKEAFYDNAPVKHPVSVGIPKGHIAIERFLTVPVLLAGELVGQIALSNATRAFSDRDLDAINRIAEFYALAIHRKRAEEDINQLNQELEQRVIQRTAKLEAANKELEAFAYSVSHDLRAPLRHIDGFLELLQKKAGTAQDHQSRHYMKIISDSTKKMGLLIDDLLSFSRMGRQTMVFQLVDLRALVRDVIRELEPDTAGRNIAWRIGDLPAVIGDAALLRMVMVNLISNALKFTRPKQQAEIEVGSLPGQNGEDVLFVRDNGVGFDMTYKDKLFGVFQRLHRAEEFEGTGIGLANVRRIITRHGGRTWAEGVLDQGAAFYFALPRKRHRGVDVS